MENLRTSSIVQPNALKASSTENPTVTSVKQTVNNALKSTDDFITKKVSQEGNNPFGSRNDVNPNKTPNGTLEKQFVNSIKKLDINNDGFVSRRELVDSSNSNKLDDKDSALVGALLESQSKLENLSDDEMGLETKGITKKDIIALDELPDASELKSNTEVLYSNSLYKIMTVKNTVQDKSGNFKLPTKASDVDFKQIHQGSLGDCYFLAVLASFAQKNPQKIVDMIKDNKDGTFTVKFPDKSVTIKAPNKTELGMYSSESNSAWVPIIEKGYAAYRQDKTLIKKTNEYDNIGKGSTIIGRGMYELTGNLFDTDVVKVHSLSDTKNKLVSAQNGNKMIVASINKGLIAKNKYDLPDGHVYTVLGIDPKTDMVKIRNPWGSGEGNVKGGANGIFELPLSEFKNTFSSVAYER